MAEEAFWGVRREERDRFQTVSIGSDAILSGACRVWRPGQYVHRPSEGSIDVVSRSLARLLAGSLARDRSF